MLSQKIRHEPESGLLDSSDKTLFRRFLWKHFIILITQFNLFVIEVTMEQSKVVWTFNYTANKWTDMMIVLNILLWLSFNVPSLKSSFVTALALDSP